MMLVNAATMAANTATLAHNQFRAATTSQALKPMNTSDASTTPISHAAPSPNRTIAAAVTTQSTQISPRY